MDNSALPHADPERLAKWEENTLKDPPYGPKHTFSPAKAAALAEARAKRQIAKERTPPEGYRSVEHFLDTAREFIGRRSGYTLELARYLRVNESSVRRWIKREKIPLQETLNSIHRWMLSKKAGL